jgi:hypothetical protein
MKKYILLLPILSVPFFLTGCGELNIPDYSADYYQVQHLKKTGAHTTGISLGKFNDATNEKNIQCRAAANIAPNGGESYANYIRAALKSELVSAGLYHTNAQPRLSATLTELQADNGLSNPHWIIAMRFNDHHQAPYRVRSEYTYDGHFIADDACKHAANVFVDATKKFLNKLYHNSHFKKTLQGL